MDYSSSFAKESDRGGFPTAHALYAPGHYDFVGGEQPRCVAELGIQMINCMIRDKPEWWTKVNDRLIVSRWAAEASASAETEEESERVNKQFQYALNEARWLASEYPGPSRPAAVDGVFARDDMPDRLREALLSDIVVLRSRPAIGATHEDRHPGTPQMVDLVHPSLYCYERGRTVVVPGSGADVVNAPPWNEFIGIDGVIEKVVERPKNRNGEPNHFVSLAGLTWLPAECRVTKNESGELQCRFLSYINSLHPKQYPKLYRSLGELFCHTVPLFEDALAEVGTNDAKRERPNRIEVEYDWWEGEPREQEDDEPDSDYWDYYEDFMDNQRVFKHPDIPDFSPPEYRHPKMDVSLKDRPLQVIVKMASLELEPGESYDGGVWHIEGTLDERIVATACCYIDCENVEGGELEFRTAVCSPSYEQNDNDGVLKMYDLSDDDTLVQNRGSCSVHSGRVLVWPNTMQHRVSPVRLVDESRPGRRSIVCFFLVDPSLRIRSTATVPPQQQEWLAQEVKAILFRQFSDVIVDHICSFTPGMSYDEASQRREKLMDERRLSVETRLHGNLFQQTFSLCEH